MAALRTLILLALLFAASISARAQLNDSQGLSYTTSGSTATVSGFSTTTSGAITIPSTINSYAVTDIAEKAFEGCTAITSVTFEGSVVVGKEAFSGCTSLKSITVASTGNVDFDDYALYQVTSLETAAVEDGGSISYIGTSAFNGCTALKSIDLVGDLEDIGNYAFYECTSLKSITTPSSLTEIGEEAFRGCKALTEINLNEGLKTIGKQAFRGDALISSLTLPATTQTIGYGAFYDNNAIRTVTVPKSVTTISEYCFYNCYALEKLYFEGGKLTTIPSWAFANCNKLEEINIGEGITTIAERAFSSCEKLRTVTLPKSVTSFGNQIFIDCEALDTVKLYAAVPPTTTSATFSEMKSGVTILVPSPSKYSGWSSYFGSIGEVFTFEKNEETETTTPEISTSEEFSAIDVFRALSDSKGDYYNANVDMKDDISFTPTTLDLENLSANNIFTVLDAFPFTESYDGKMAGATISNMAMRSQGVFGTIGKDAEIDGLVFEDATLYVDPTDSETYEVDGDDVTIHILAKTNNGTVTNFGFSGDIIVDEDFASGKEISVCAVNDNSSADASISGYVRIGSLLTAGDGDTKRCITIKQNLGIKRPPGKKTKIATSKSLSTSKSTTTQFTYSDEELNKSIREFTDEEFAGGAVAYWLNFDGPGYTGNYTGYWAQGKKVPVPATSTNGVTNALSAVDYGTTDQTHITSAPQFANNGSQVTIEYDQTPESVTIGGVAYTGFGAKSMTVTFDNTKAISIAFSKGTTSVAQPKETVKVTTSGLTATASGATSLKLVSLTGKVVATSEGQTITAPKEGLYMLLVDGQAHKVLLK